MLCKGLLVEGQLKPLWGQTPPEAQQKVPLEGSAVVWQGSGICGRVNKAGQEVRSSPVSETALVIEMEEPGMCFALMSTFPAGPHLLPDPGAWE